MWFRAPVATIALCAWAILIWLATHRSDSAQWLGRYSTGYLTLLAAVSAVALLLSMLLLPRPFARVAARRLDLTMVLVSLVGSLALAEFAVRLTDPFGISYYEASKTYQLAKVPDPDLVYRHPDNWHAELQGVAISTNELGLRDPPIKAKQAGEYRVLLLGDSVAFGWGVRDAETLARQLERLLAQALERPVRVINSGVGSYNTEQEVRFLEQHHRALEPDVVIMLTVENDDDVHDAPFDAAAPFVLASKSPPEVVKLLVGRLWTYRLVAHFYRHGADADSGAQRNAPGWLAALRAYGAFGEFCASRSTRCVTLFYRMRANAKNTAMLNEYRKVAERRGQALVDTLPWFEGQDIRNITNSFVDVHPNAAGHRIMAGRTSDLLRTMR